MFVKRSLILYGCLIIFQLKSLWMISADDDAEVGPAAGTDPDRNESDEEAATDSVPTIESSTPVILRNECAIGDYIKNQTIILKNDECGEKLLPILFNDSAIASLECVEYSNDDFVHKLLNSSNELPNFIEIQKLSLRDIKFSNDNKLYVTHAYSKMREIEVSKCYLEEVQFQKSLELLETINLSDNYLTEKSVIFFARLSNVTTLNLNDNYFSVLSWKSFTKLVSLKKLLLAGNLIISISHPHGTFTLPKELNFIDLSDNYIKQIIPQLNDTSLEVNLTNNALDCSYFSGKNNNLRNIGAGQSDAIEPRVENRTGRSKQYLKTTTTPSPRNSIQNGINVTQLEKLEKLIEKEHFYYSISFLTAYSIALIGLTAFAICIIDKCCNCNCKSNGQKNVKEEKLNNLNLTINDDNKYPEEIYYAAPPEDYYECTPEPSRKDHQMELYAVVHKNKNHSDVNQIVQAK